jgi:hypothetical protein
MSITKTGDENAREGHAVRGPIYVEKSDGTLVTIADTDGNVDAPVTPSSVTSTGVVVSTSATAGVGYATGAGGAVTQATNRATGVTLSTVCGTITTDTTSLAAGAAATFTVTNTAVAITDVVVASIQSGETTDQTNVRVTGTAAGSFDVTVENNHASTAETGAILINFAVIKGVIA